MEDEDLLVSRTNKLSSGQDDLEERKRERDALKEDYVTLTSELTFTMLSLSLI